MNNSEKAKIQVGQKLWLVATHYYNHEKKEPVEVTVSKVGRKYFELTEKPRKKFNINNLREENETNYQDQCYLSLQEILDKTERQSLIGRVRKIFSSYACPNEITLEQIRKIAEVLQIKD
jgi:uncharacterized tellurite resistance protein B-like protein